METSDYFCFGLFWIVPIAFTIWWVRMKLGNDKRWFVVSAWPLVSSSFYFFLPTFLVGFILLLVDSFLATIDPNRDVNILLLSVPLFWASGFIFAFLEPGWMSPAWYQWLKRKHGDIMPYLARDAHEMGRKTWVEKVKTQQGLEQWVAEVQRKHGL